MSLDRRGGDGGAPVGAEVHLWGWVGSQGQGLWMRFGVTSEEKGKVRDQGQGQGSGYRGWGLGLGNGGALVGAEVHLWGWAGSQG